MGFFDFLTEEIAIDLGTANTLIIWNDKVVVDEPSIVAKDIQTGKIVAIGKRAQQMHGKTHKLIETVRPLRDGVIADFAAAQKINLVVTLGEDGVVIADGAITKVAAQKVKPVDTTGAGDCFVGSFAFGLAMQMSPAKAAALGCQTAGLSVTRLGAQSSYPTAVEVSEFLPA